MLLRGTEVELELLGIRERLCWSGNAYGKGIPRHVLPSSGPCSEEKPLKHGLGNLGEKFSEFPGFSTGKNKRSLAAENFLN